jgi:hypothetical protein
VIESILFKPFWVDFVDGISVGLVAFGDIIGEERRNWGKCFAF